MFVCICLQHESKDEQMPKEFTFREFQEYMTSNSSDILDENLVGLIVFHFHKVFTV